MTQAAKTRIKGIRQSELRDKLRAGGHLQQVVLNIGKIDKLKVTSKTFKNSLEKLKATTDYQLKLVNKYLPDLRSTELTGDLNLRAKEFSDMYDDE